MNQYQPLEPIGSGSFGIIRKVKRLSDGKYLARKEIDYKKMTEKEKLQLVAEVNILRELRHPNIVRYYERMVDRENSMIYIIMEYCEGGDLSSVIRKCIKEKRYIPEDVIWNLLSQLIQALNECHNSKSHSTILHRDIKPENVFLDKCLNVKLGDFGLSRTIENPEVEFAKTYVGTPYYMSPELVDESHYNAKSDIWALGCLIYELSTLQPPFQSKSHSGLVTKIKMGKVPSIPNHFSRDLDIIIKSMFVVDYHQRPDAVELMGHPRIRLAVKEQEMSGMRERLRLKDDELSRKSDMLDTRERHLNEFEKQLYQLQVQLEEREKHLVERESKSNLGLSGFSPMEVSPAPKLKVKSNLPLSPMSSRYVF
ncbi:kinase-like domain-containing protein [Globomyces pollinis-pini]|nr:kinase-like domain-containing protein [Globomyces pollinis-pini]